MKMRRLVLLSLFALIPLSTAAQNTPRYGAWQTGKDQLQTMTEELRSLVDEAARARAADPRFLDDLRALADKYGNPWPHLLVREDFRDGNYTVDPAWTVVSGQFEMDWQGGMYSKVVAPSVPPPAQKEPDRKVRGEDIALQLLGQILNPQAQSGGRQQQASPPPANPPQPAIPAEAYLAQPVSNAFSLEARLAMEGTAGPVTFGPFQGQRRTAGYFLEYDPVSGLTLQRRGSTGTVPIATGPAQLADGADHTVKWTRARNGDMAVSVDGAEALRVTDTSFRDAWSGVSYRNGGGAMTLRAIEVFGTR